MTYYWTIKLYRIYSPSCSSKRLYVKHIDNEMYDKIATITGPTLGLKSY